MRRPLLCATILTGLGLGGCQHDRREITPTTLGTDLRQIPRGTMKPLPWPGQDLVKNPPRTQPTAEPTVDPAASMASGETAPR